MTLELLVARLVGDVGHVGCLNTISGLLLVKLLESVFVEVYRCRSESLWCGLEVWSQLIDEVFQTRSPDFLSG